MGLGLGMVRRPGSLNNIFLGECYITNPCELDGRRVKADSINQAEEINFESFALCQNGPTNATFAYYSHVLPIYIGESHPWLHPRGSRYARPNLLLAICPVVRLISLMECFGTACLNDLPPSFTCFA